MQQNVIHHTAVIDFRAKIGTGNIIGPFTVIGPNVEIGNGNKISGHVSIGTPAEHKDYFREFGKVKIGNDNNIREFVTVNASTTEITEMGSRCIMLRGSHLSHDSVLEDDVTVSCNVLIGGESRIMTGANLGLGAIIHQRQVIGSYAMLGMGTVVTKKSLVYPGGIYVGNPAKFLKKNEIALERMNVTEGEIKNEEAKFLVLKGLR